MWRRVEVTASIDQPVERVFAYLADPLRWHEFAPACIYRRQIGDGPPRVGSRWEATDLIGPFPMRFVDELIELEPNLRVVWWSSAPWNARVEYACQPDVDGRTRIRATYEGNITGSLRFLVGWLPGSVTHWILAQDFRRLRRVLAREVTDMGSNKGSPLVARGARARDTTHPTPDLASSRPLEQLEERCEGAYLLAGLRALPIRDLERD